MIHAGGRDSSWPVLLLYKLKQYACAEFKIFILFLKVMIELKIEQGYGNPFVQSIHDGVTLDNHKKYQAFWLQMVDPNWLCNLVICIGFH